MSVQQQDACQSNVESKACEEALNTLSPFEIKNKLIQLAKADTRKSTEIFLNAGRGNPNWITVKPRQAFFLLGKFSIAEAKLSWEKPEIGIAGIPLIEGAGERFQKFLDENKEESGADLLQGAFDYLVKEKGANPDEVAQEWASAINGDEYPTPDRILKFTQVICRDYLALQMGDNAPHNDDYDLFATEGGTAAMCYAFNSAWANHLIKPGNKMALMVPVFTPYIEIPQLDKFDLDVINIYADAIEKNGYHDWQYPDSEIEKLRDPSIKFLCVVNPSNPPSYALSQHTLDLMVDIVTHDNPNLMIVTDDVYGTFVDNFKSLMYVLPYNTLCVYSFSKYFGATGWRLAVMALNKNNVYDHLIANLPEEEKKDLARRYSSLTLDVAGLKYIDRLVADSRLVALNHTAGLGTPQQMQMSLFAAFSLLDKDQKYKAQMQGLIHERLGDLWQPTGFKLEPNPLRAGYYSEIDMMLWSKKLYGEAFAQWLNATYDPLDVVVKLANDTAVVLLNGDGFDGPKWSVRCSLANLYADDYLKIGRDLRVILDNYYKEYLASIKDKTVS